MSAQVLPFPCQPTRRAAHLLRTLDAAEAWAEFQQRTRDHHHQPHDPDVAAERELAWRRWARRYEAAYA